MIDSWSSFGKSRFVRSVNVLQMHMGNAVRRQEAISNNISNVDTPHYKRKMITFESEFNRVLASEKRVPTPFRSTDSRHIPAEVPKHYLSVNSNVLEEFDSNYRNDKNNVDIEKEVGDMVKNSLHYNASATIISRTFARIKSVMAA